MAPCIAITGGAWDSIGRFYSTGATYLNTAVVYHDTLIVAGTFMAVNDTPVVGIACYDGAYWHPYGRIGYVDSTQVQQPQLVGTTSRLRVIDDTLYALGLFPEADGQPCRGVVKRVGGHWEGVPMPENLNAEPWFNDIAKYQGHLIVAGNFSTADQSIYDLMQLNGDTWEPICDCLHGGFDGAGVLAVYKGELYVGGGLHISAGDPGEGVIRWDGTTWRSVGDQGGLQLDDGVGDFALMNAMTVRDSLLFLGGRFRFADHLPANYIATWDGHHFCSLGGYPGTWVTAMDFYQDTLYVATGAQSDQPQGPAPNCVAKFTGTSYQLECSTTGVEEQAAPMDGFGIAPESSDAIALLGLTDGRHAVEVWDAQGRLLLATQTQSEAGRSASLHVGALDEAVYLVRVDRRMTSRFVPIH